MGWKIMITVLIVLGCIVTLILVTLYAAIRISGMISQDEEK